MSVRDVPVPVASEARARNYSIDFMRVSLFTCVVIVHSVGTINLDDVVREMSGMSMLFHFTRYGFVFVTLFVLCVAYRKRQVRPVSFWRYRFSTIVLPYVLWSAIYVLSDAWLLSPDGIPGIGELAHNAGLGILRGDAKYHLYFLLISMQIYLLFPLIRSLIRKTMGHHGLLLAGAGVLQMSTWCAIAFTDPQSPVLAVVHEHAWKTLPTYAFFAAAGALCAYHFDRVDGWFRSHVPLVLALCAIGATISIGAYTAVTDPGHVPDIAASPVNPATLPWHVAAIAVLYLIGTAWNDRRGDGTGWVGRAVDFGSLRAFGVFAAHPLVIDLVHKAGLGTWLFSAFPESSIVRSTILFVAVLAGSLVLVETLLRTPLSKQLMARPRVNLGVPRRLGDGAQRSAKETVVSRA